MRHFLLRIGGRGGIGGESDLRVRNKELMLANDPHCLETACVPRFPLRDYFRSSQPNLDEVRDTVWSDGVSEGTYGVGGKPYHDAVLEQYKLYVEMTDRISARRATMNSYFLSLNTAIAVGVSFVWGLLKSSSVWLLLFPLLMLLVLSGTWFALIKSYRQLNAAKYVVIEAMEERLPASPYVRAEWAALGKGEDRARYWPMSRLEQGVPVVFAVLYTIAFVVVAVTGR